MEGRKQEIEQLNEHYQKAIDAIMDPGKSERERKELANNPLFSAGMRGLDRLKWDLGAARAATAASQLRSQAM